MSNQIWPLSTPSLDPFLLILFTSIYAANWFPIPTEDKVMNAQFSAALNVLIAKYQFRPPIDTFPLSDTLTFLQAIMER